ncbi:hypothetical protein GTN66_06815 [bacterium]|nr:hypothetical protein [bacterium]NIN93179.1 hypothetical protein [bacterium]NIO18976.1 hypothetical protein [bacterium]NIO74105.1 hypothetical protein [bacterium]
MKIILRSLIVCSLFFLTVGGLEGRGGEEQIGKEWVRMVEHKREKFHEKRLQRLCQELELSKEQEEKVSQIMKTGWEKIQAEMRKMKERVGRKGLSNYEKGLGKNPQRDEENEGKSPGY